MKRLLYILFFNLMFYTGCTVQNSRTEREVRETVIQRDVHDCPDGQCPLRPVPFIIIDTGHDHDHHPHK